ncbi:hypothetical protein Bca101_025803 [Brassica carinata]
MGHRIPYPYCNIPGPAQNETQVPQVQEGETQTLTLTPPISYKRGSPPSTQPQERQQAKPCPTPPPSPTAACSPSTGRPARSPSRRSRVPSRRLLDSFSYHHLRSES